MMETFSGPLSGPPVPVCPACGGSDIEPVSFRSDINSLCRTCWTCWHRSLDWLEPVRPTGCDGCDHQAECLLRSPLLFGSSPAVG